MLYDVDKGSEDRGSPNPNVLDVLASGAIKAHGTHSINYTTDATDPNLIKGIGNAQTTIIQSGTFISPDLSYNPAAPITDPHNTTLTLGAIPHGLSFKPGIIAYLTLDSGIHYSLPHVAYTASGTTAAAWTKWWCAVDLTNVNFFLDVMSLNNNSVGLISVSFKYYLTQQVSADS